MNKIEIVNYVLIFIVSLLVADRICTPVPRWRKRFRAWRRRPFCRIVSNYHFAGAVDAQRARDLLVKFEEV